MKFNLLKILTTFVLVIAMSVSFSLAEETDDIDWDNAGPAQIHQYMGELKALALSKRLDIEREMAQSQLLSTQTNYDVIFYDIDLKIDESTEIVDGSVGIVARATEDNVSEVQVDLYDNMLILYIVSEEYGNLSFSRSNNVVTVTLGRSYSADEEFEFTVFYNGHPIEGGFQAFSFGYRLNSPIMATLSEPYFARTWWPCKDRMDDKADSFNIAITVDTSLYVASNGTLDSTVLATGRFHTSYYRVRYPMTTYLFSLAISKYTVWYDEWVYNEGLDTMPLVHAVYPDYYNYSLPRYGIVPYALDVLSDNFGMYPFVEEKYGHANFQWGGGMEHQTMTSMVGGSFGFSEPVVVHELTHQWWGDMITCESWEDIWLNEGWASYGEAVYYLEKDGWDAYQNYMNDMAYFGGGSVWVDDTTSIGRIFSGSLSYDKGAWVCHMLRGLLDDSLFFEGVDAYYSSEFQHNSATTEDFKNVFESATGVELDYYFDQWVYGEYYPVYGIAHWFEESDTSGYDVYIEIRQDQTLTTQLFKMPVDITFDFVDGSSDTMTFWVENKEHLFKVNVPDSLTAMALDPSDWILKKVNDSFWWINIITFNDEISEGTRYIEYLDTIQCRSLNPYSATEITSGSLPPGLTIDNEGIISGVPSDSGLYNFSVRFIIDEFGASEPRDFSIYINNQEYTPGDVDLSEELDIGDVVFTAEFMFLGGPEPLLMNSLDVDSSCEIDIGDLVYLVEYHFLGGEVPLPGCVD